MIRDRITITRYIDDYARELHDEAPAGASVSRALNLYVASRLSLEDFCELLVEARTRTQQGSHRVRKEFSAAAGGKPKMAYFFAVLEDLIGLPERQRTA